VIFPFAEFAENYYAELNLKSYAQVEPRYRQLPMHMIAADIRFMALRAKPLAKLRAEAVAFLRSFSA
jgi:hypothetical protein